MTVTLPIVDNVIDIWTTRNVSDRGVQQHNKPNVQQ